MDQIKPRTNFKKTYDFKCCGCGKKLWAAPSLFMLSGMMNSGAGRCPTCKAHFHLEIYPDLKGDYMICIEWNKYLKGIKKKEGIG